jgi:acyl carrier protein
MNSDIRELVAAHAGLPVGVDDLPDHADLYRAGMKSFASVQLMLALEERFGIEFPEEMLTRATFRSIAAIEEAVGKLTAGEMAA